MDFNHSYFPVQVYLRPIIYYPCFIITPFKSNHSKRGLWFGPVRRFKLLPCPEAKSKSLADMAGIKRFHDSHDIFQGFFAEIGLGNIMVGFLGVVLVPGEIFAVTAGFIENTRGRSYTHYALYW
ncbi:hypothetical protein ES705_47411 [subsurface metagenome]